METYSPIARAADSPAFVLSIYTLAVLPLGLYLYHDILDTRWRRVQNLNFYLCLYFWLYLSAALALAVYTVFQAFPPDHKEIGASFVALLLASYGVLKLARLYRILDAHKRIVEGPIAWSDMTLRRLNPTNGRQKPYTISFRDRPLQHRIAENSGEPDIRSHYLSSALFDDDYPGSDAARIKWLKWNGKTEVMDEDADEAAMRMALFIRFSLRSAKMTLWNLVCATHPLVIEEFDRISVGKMLRRLIKAGSAKRRSKHVGLNPVEDMLNGTTSMSQLGVSWFWICSEMSSEEMAQAVSQFPQRWLRGATSSGADLVYETSILSILSDHTERIPEEFDFEKEVKSYRFSRDGDDKMLAQAPDLADYMLQLPDCSQHTFSEITSVDGTTRIPIDERFPSFSRFQDPVESLDGDERLSVAKKCTHALLVALLGNKSARAQFAGTQGLEMQSLWAVSKTFFYASIADEKASDMFRVAVVELLLTSQFASIVGETVLGPSFKERLRNNFGEQASLESAEISWGLAAIIEQLEWAKPPEFNAMLRKWAENWGISYSEDKDTMFTLVRRHIQDNEGALKMSRVTGPLWMIEKDTGVCPDPEEAFLSYVHYSAYFAEGVLCAFWGLAETIARAEENGDGSEALELLRLPSWFKRSPDLHVDWLNWKRNGQGQERAVRTVFS